MQFSALRLARRSIVVAFAASCGLGSLGVAVWAGEVRDEPETVAPVEFGAAKPVKPLDSLAVVAPGSLATVVPNSSKVVSPNSLTFVAPSKSELVGAVGFNLNNVARDVALEQIKAGTLTPEAAWQSGALTFDNIADLLEKESDIYLINYREGSDGLHHRLLGVLLQHESARLQSLDKVSPRLRLWLANYYWLQGDARTIEVAQSLLDEFPPPAVGPQMIAYQALERIAWFQRGQGQHQKSAETWLQWKAYQGGPSWALINAKLEAARAYANASDEEKSKALYAEIAQGSEGWDLGLVRYDQAQALIKSGNDQEARLLLLQPLVGTDAAKAQIGLLSLLSASYLKTGEVDLAQSTAREALETYKGLKDSEDIKGLESQVERARKVLDWCWRYKAGNANPAAENTKTVAPADVELPSTKG